jgi:hypothetical protein
VNDVHVFFWGGNAALALLLKTVQNEHSFLELHRVDCTICSTRIIFNNLKQQLILSDRNNRS